MRTRYTRYVLHVQSPASCLDRQPIANTNDLPNAFNSRSLEVLGLHPNQTCCGMKHLGPDFPAHRRLQRKQMMADEADQPHQDVTRKGALDPPRDVARLLA